MELTIPIYVEKTSSQFGSGAEFVVRPLFLGEPVERSERLQSAMQKLSMALRRQLTDLGRRPQHDELARWSFLPKFSTKQCKVRIEVEGHSARLRLLVVTMSLWGRRIAFIPICPDVWFDLQREESVEERLVAVLTEFIKQRWKIQPGEGVAAFECWSLSGSAFVTELELEWTPPRLRKLPTLDNRLFLGAREALEGEWELYRVGRCLNQLYPDGLDRARQREAEVEELQRLLLAEDRRPILLLGRPQSGKTAVLHEHVFRQVAKTRRSFDNRQAVWLLSPQRLISGMSYVGQWEERFHAIINYAAQRDLTLYIDDLLGLFQAGVTDQSSISVGSLLKEVLEKRRVRVVGELTPGAWHVLQERDRGFANLFHVLPIADVEGDNNLRILFELQRQLEFQHRVRFHLDAIPTIIDLQRRYNPTPAFPGKGAAMLQRLAVRGDEEAASQNEKSVSLISRQSVLRLMHQQSGLPLSFLDRRQTLSPAEIEAGLRERFVGQPQAVAAAVEIIGIARARLNDPTRPLGSLLLLGPTGVGKTEFAKSLASFLFGRPDRLLRFDMNEFVSPNAVPLLTGTFDQPEGLLTAAVRRQPFAVLLFDEIEKGHPALLDLLLQVLGEGRLTDARGRTTDFTNTLIVLTSNLGTRRTESDLGFGGGGAAVDHSAVRVAESFFLPEFFNRLDRVIPFGRLSREEMQVIARHLMSDVLKREGLARRRCVLKATEASADWIVEQGYHPVLGARALKRAMERELARPIAAFLAANPGPKVLSEDSLAGGERGDEQCEPITLIRVDRGAESLVVDVRQLEPEPRTTNPRAVADQPDDADLATCRQLVQALRQALPALRTTQTYGPGPLPPAQVRYLIVQDELHRLERGLEVVTAALEARRKENAVSGTAVPIRGTKRRAQTRKWSTNDLNVDDHLATQDIHDYLSHKSTMPDNELAVPDSPEALLARCRWLHQVAFVDLSRMDESAVLEVACLDLSMRRHLGLFSQRLRDAWTEEVGLETTADLSREESGVVTLKVSGILARDYTNRECGYHSIGKLALAVPGLLWVREVGLPGRDVLVRSLRFTGEGKELLAPRVADLRQHAWNAMSR
jgi:ATP-dependent Clp protease ATP-binding subunit ClpC